MGFFKDFKNDLTQAVNELLPDEEIFEKASEDHLVNTLDEDDQLVNTFDSEDHLVNTLDTGDLITNEVTNTEKMKEWLEEFAQNEQDILVDNIADANNDTIDDTTEVDLNIDTFTKDNMENEVKDMDDNIDLELLEVMNAEEHEEEVMIVEKSEVKVRSASVVNDDEVTVISKGTTIHGSISSEGSIDIMGNVTGDIECLGKLSISGKVIGNSTAAEVYVNTERLEGSISSEGSVKVGLGTVIIGDIVATSGVIAGAVKGEIDINGPIVIDSTAIIKGNIKAKSVQINNGAVVEGFCSLSYADVDVENIFE